MRNFIKFGALTASCAAVAIMAPTTDASAGVMSVAGKTTIAQSSLIDQVHYRRYCHRHHGHWHYGWHYGYYRHYGYHPWRYRYGWYPRYRYSYYPYGGYGYGWYNPAGAVAGAALGLASTPLWGLGGGYPYYW